ncbi:unnamed protein product [Blepharisma stoltei]|uniref:Uncharacterized protein n=1 Tax=Blepharisma stoltei TaxID=1481888 RepID=A0AAU9IQJ5_9CILI|nr:unnamed protein product [Blepharisma stoltei]
MVEVGKRKEQGNTFFKENKFDDAIRLYSEAADCEDATKELKAVCYGNISLCYLRLNNPTKSLEYCDYALGLKPDYQKVRERKIGLLLDAKRIPEARLEMGKGEVSDDLKAKVEEAEKEENDKILEDEKAMEREADLETEAREKEKQEKKKNLNEMTTAMKELANDVLEKFGMSLDCFKVKKSKEGKYCVDFS